MTVSTPAAAKATPAASEQPAQINTSAGSEAAAERRVTSSDTGRGQSAPASPSRERPPW